MNFAKILVPLDLEWPAPLAVQAASQLARHFHAEVVILYVVKPATFLGIETGNVDNLLRRAQKEEADLNAQIAADLAGVPYRRLLLPGDPGQVILGTAHSEKADLIVMSPHARTRFGRLFDSVTQHILNSSTIPVWSVSSPEKPSQTPNEKIEDQHERPSDHQEDRRPLPDLHIRNIVCGVDFTTHDAHVVKWAAAAGEEFHAGLILAHATPAVEIYGPGGYHEVLGLKEHLTRASDARMHDLLLQTGVHADSFIGSGHPYKVLDHAAREHQGDLLVIGSHACTGNPGGHAYQIVTHAQQPVFCV